MIISDKNKYVFISVMKSGTHSMYDYLVKNYDGFHFTRGVNLGGGGRYHTNEINGIHSNYYKFTLVRNPYSRAISIYNVCKNVEPYCSDYKNRICANFTFLDFCKWISSEACKNQTGRAGYVVRPQSEWLAPCGQFDKVLHVENAEDEIKDLPFVHDVKPFPNLLERTDKSKWKEFYNEETANLIYKWAENDFTQYGYEKESWR
jgi:hypothetical protein